MAPRDVQPLPDRFDEVSRALKKKLRCQGPVLYSVLLGEVMARYGVSEDLIIKVLKTSAKDGHLRFRVMKQGLTSYVGLCDEEPPQPWREVSVSERKVSEELSKFLRCGRHPYKDWDDLPENFKVNWSEKWT